MPTPTEQLLTRTVYATDGVTTNWDFSFSGGYLDKAHIKAYTEAPTGERTDIVVSEAMVVGPYQLLITPALASGLVLTVYRDTPKNLPLVDFTDESGFSEVALDTNAKQAVFIAAETTDTVNTSSSYDAEQAADQAATAAATAVAAQVTASAAAVSATASALAADASADAAEVSAASASAVFTANTTAFTRTLLDDATAAAARATLGAAESGGNSTITSLSALFSVNGGSLGGLRNRIINGNFSVNQRTYASGAAVGAGLYGHDRWKMAASADTYTFSTTDNVTTVTIPAGKVLRQVVEGLNLESGLYVLTWAGTAQGKIGANAYGESATTGFITGGTNTTIEFGPGTVSKVQLEITAQGWWSMFEQRPYALELALCQRYLPAFAPANTSEFMAVGYTASTTTAVMSMPYTVTPRVRPTGIITTSPGNFQIVNSATFVANTLTYSAATSSTLGVIAVNSTGITANQSCALQCNTAAARIFFTGCEL